MSRSRAWTFTINNYKFDDVANLLDLEFRYLIFGFEVAPKTNTPHIQGYIYFYEAKTLQSVSKKIPRSHLQISKGTSKQNQVYCSKEHDYYEFGELPTQGKASWDKIEDVMQDPKSNIHLYSLYRKAYSEILKKEKSEHDRLLKIIKEEEKYKVASEHDTVSFDYSFDTYDDEQAVIVPTFVNKQIIEQWIHGYPVKIKRGYEIITVDPEYIYIYYSDQKEYRYLIKNYIQYI